jgi:hypothetical protein
VARGAFVAAALIMAATLPAQGRPLIAAGRVVRITATDTIPAAGAVVVLHRIGRDRQGPLDSMITDAAGRFRFSVPADSAALHLLTSRHDGVQYFSEPVHANPDRPDTALVLAVHDTSSAQPVELAARSIVVSAPAADGTRNVIELLAVRNVGPLTRVPADTSSAAWGWRIPRDVLGFAADEGELSAGAIELRGDSVLVRAALPPGLREITIEYHLPASRGDVRFPFDEAAASVNLLIEESDASLSLPGALVPDSATVIEERRFRRWAGAVRAGEAISASLPVAGRFGSGALAALIGLVVLALAAGAAVAFRGGRHGRITEPSEAGADELIEAIARLDAARSAAGPLDADAERRYAGERAALKARLERALARQSRAV